MKSIIFWLFHVVFLVCEVSKDFTLQVFLSLVQNAMCMQLMLRHHCSRAIVVKSKHNSLDQSKPEKHLNVSCKSTIYFASYSKQFGLVNGDAKFVLIPRNECQSLPSNIHWPWINHTIYYCFISLHHLHLVGLVCWFQSKTMLLHKPHCLV